MKKNRLISILLIIVIVFSYCPIVFADVIDADNGKMKYYKKYSSSSSFDIKGYVNGKLQSTTFNDTGYETKLKVDDNEAVQLYLGENEEEYGIDWDITCSFINNGRYVKITYTLTNNNETNSTISLGTYVDVQIAGNDKATIERFENSNGLKLYDNETNIQFSFYGKSVAGTTDIDNLWIGEYWDDYEEKCFDNNTTNKIEGIDSAFTYSWTNRKIEPGETKTYSVIIGMGEVSNAPKIELDPNQGKCFSQDSIIINGFITDADANSKATLYYTVDNEAENNLSEANLTNNKYNFSLDLTSNNLSIGTHTIKLWAIDESGNPSEVLEKEILITNLKSPTLNMNEEWSNNPVKFTITDNQNDPEDVLKYQYKIDDGDWQDAMLNTEIVALENTGTSTVYAKAVGKQTDEQSSIVSKTAKVDKEGPTINISEEDNKIIISATDEQSGLSSIGYLFNSEQELNGQEVFLEYKEPIDCTNIESGDLYLHIISTDLLGNESIYTKEYKEPVPATIVTEEKFTGKNPTYKITDENNQGENGYIYQIKINDKEWQDISLDTEYTIENPNSGINIIKTRTVDILGRISQESEVQTNYLVEDNTIAMDKLPNTGKAIIIVGIAAITLLSITVYIKYSKLKQI